MSRDLPWKMSMQSDVARLLLACSFAALAAAPGAAQIRPNPTGVNINTQAATTVFITFGPLQAQTPAEAFWCGELIPAAPDVGMKCDPRTIFGQLPARHELGRLSGIAGFTDIMSVPPSVARRAYQAAANGEASPFFYVRRFVSMTGGPDEYVAVTCRLAGGGARTPLALTDVQLAFDVETPVLFITADTPLPPFFADIRYNGTGRLIGRWEVVRPGDELPGPRDLLTEATLPLEERGTQRRFTEIERFNLFLPPTGRVRLNGPDPARFPASVEGTYLILLRIEASDEREADSDLRAVGVGDQVVHSGGVAGFPMPVLRYVIGSGGSELARSAPSVLTLLAPAPDAALEPGRTLEFSWTEVPLATLYRLEIEGDDGRRLLAALVPRGTAVYRAPPWLADRAAGRPVRWRVIALALDGAELTRSAWRALGAP